MTISIQFVIHYIFFAHTWNRPGAHLVPRWTGSVRNNVPELAWQRSEEFTNGLSLTSLPTSLWAANFSFEIN